MTTPTPSHPLAQSLGSGLPGLALVAVEHALAGHGPWEHVRQLLRHIATAPIDASEHASLFYGAPAIAFVLHAATADGQARAAATAVGLQGHVQRLTQQRLSLAAGRKRTGKAASFHEYDLFYGLTGLGALLLRTAPGSDTLENVLRYVARLAHPQELDGQMLPGWWAGHDPDALAPTPGGHANLGMAHGAAGLLAFLGTAARHGHTVAGQIEAIENLHLWFEQWRQDGPDGSWWPEWVTRDNLRTGRPSQQVPGRPSWCYGAVGIARAQQIAAIATSDHHRRAQAEAAIAACLTSHQLARLTDAGLCHGIAGLYQTAFRAATDAIDPTIRQRLSAAASTLEDHRGDQVTDPGLLDGQAGLDLAVLTHHSGQPPTSGWDACLLIS